jgi:hypothetical protein
MAGGVVGRVCLGFDDRATRTSVGGFVHEDAAEEVARNLDDRAGEERARKRPQRERGFGCFDRLHARFRLRATKS